MQKMKLVKAKQGATVVGTGFLPLDLVYRDDDPSKLQAYAGGTCGNVLAILAFLGWDVYPIARHSDSALAQIIKDDLKLWGAHLEFIGLEPTAAARCRPKSICEATRREDSQFCLGLPRMRSSTSKLQASPCQERS